MSNVVVVVLLLLLLLLLGFVCQVLLPFLTSCGEFVLLQLFSAPAVAGLAIAAFALVQVSDPRSATPAS
jgi:hypothetical protein